MSAGGSEGAQSPESLDVSAASLRAETEHLDLLLHSLVDKLRAVPGLEPVITYRRSRLRRIVGDVPYVNDLHRKSSPIEAIRVTVGGSAFELSATTSSITCSVVGRGPGTERGQVATSFSEWITQLMAAIDERNRLAADSLSALQDLIVYDRVN